MGIGAANLHLFAQNTLPVIAWKHRVGTGAVHLRLLHSWPRRGSCQSPPAQPRPPQWRLHRPPAPSQLHDRASTSDKHVHAHHWLPDSRAMHQSVRTR